MSAIWKLDITPLDVSRKEARIVATRTDGEDVRTFTIITALLATAKQKSKVIDDIWDQYVADAAGRDAIDAFVGTLETQGKASLEAKENK